MSNILDVSEVLLEMGLSAGETDAQRAIAAFAITRAEGAIKRYLKYDPVQRARTEFYPQTQLNPQSRISIWEVNDTHAYRRRAVEASSEELQVRHVPIRSITSLFIDYDARSGTQSGAFSNETLKVEGTDYWPNYDGVDSDGNSFCTDGIIRSFGEWPTEPGSVKVVYTAGYSQTELRGQDDIIDASPIFDATLIEAVRRAQQAFIRGKSSRGFLPGVLKSERLGDYAYSVDSDIAKTLFGHRNTLTDETKQALTEFVNCGYTLAG